MLNRDFFEYLSSGDPRRGDLGRREFHLLRRQGHDLLAIPSALRFSRDALALYLPQTTKARAAKTVFQTILRSPLAATLSSRHVTIARNPMTDFLCAMADGQLPEFSVLLGNPAEPGRRLVIGVFSKTGECRRVVKCAIEPTGCELIESERKLLSQLHGRFPGLPEVLAASDGHGFSSFAMEFFPEPSDTMSREERVALMRQWIRSDQPVPLSSLSAWQAVASNLHRGAETLVRPVVFHGDFAPWNLRGQAGRRTVIDWEKACPHGPPLWDLLHYEVQTGILVDHLTARAVLQRVDDLLAAPATRNYLRECRAEELVEPLVDGYFMHADKYYPPIRGRETLDELLNLRRRRRDREEFNLRTARDFRPDFTIVTPSFGQLPLLRLCAASVRDQVARSKVSVEHLIQDAESPGIGDFENAIRHDLPPADGAEYRLELCSEADEGMYDAINRGFRRAHGEFVAWLNSDEQYLPGALAKVAAFFQAHPDIDVVFGDALVADSSGQLVAYRRCVLPEAWHTQLAQLGTFSCATFVRRRVLERGILPDPTVKAIADAKWIAEMKRSGVRMAVMREPLAVFMITTSNLGQSSLAKLEMMRWRKQAGWLGEFLRRPVVVWYRLRKLMAGAYLPHSIETSFYLPDSPGHRVRCVAHRLTHHWPGEQGMPEPKTGSTGKSGLLGWGLILPLLYSIAVQLIDRLALGITLTPFLSIVCLLTMAFFLPPATIALAALIFSANALLSFLDFANMLPQETADSRFVLVRFASFLAAVIAALMLSLYRMKAGKARALNASILTNMTVPLITSDAMGSVTFANARALQLLRASNERIIGDKWTKLMMTDKDQGTATRFYLGLFEGGSREQTASLTLSSQPGKTVKANFICIGENQDRILLTTLENPEASDTAGDLNATVPASKQHAAAG